MTFGIPSGAEVCSARGGAGESGRTAHAVPLCLPEMHGVGYGSRKEAEGILIAGAAGGEKQPTVIGRLPEKKATWGLSRSVAQVASRGAFAF